MISIYIDLIEFSKYIIIRYLWHFLETTAQINDLWTKLFDMLVGEGNCLPSLLQGGAAW